MKQIISLRRSFDIYLYLVKILLFISSCDVRKFSHKVTVPLQRKTKPLFFHDTGSKLHLRAFKWIIKSFESFPANSIGVWGICPTMVDAVEIRIMATIVPPSTFEPQSTVIIGTFVVFVIFGRKLHPTRNMNKSKKKITYINRMSHPLSWLYRRRSVDRNTSRSHPLVCSRWRSSKSSLTKLISLFNIASKFV